MSTAVVVGAGPTGAATALLLADRGVDVTVVDRDLEPPPATPDEAWEGWARSVGQFHQAHLMMARFRALVEEHLPAVADELVGLGALRFDFLAHAPPHVVASGRHAGDERFVTLTARRPVIDLAFQRVLARHPGVHVVRGAAVTSLVTAPAAGTGEPVVPWVVGVGIADGTVIRADVVVDASGRRSRLPQLLRDAGARAPAVDERKEGFVYFTRFFRAPDGDLPPFLAPGLTPLGSISILCLHADNGTYSVTAYTSSRDDALKGLRDPDTWTRIVGAHPLHAHWLAGVALHDEVEVMASHVGRRRSLVVDGLPVATGLVAVGDAWACTNPSLGRGVTLGLLHAVETSRMVADHLDRPDALTPEWQAATDAELGPWYDATLALDLERLAEMEAERTGVAVPPSEDPARRLGAALRAGLTVDAEVFRFYLELLSCYTLPEDLFARPGVLSTVLRAAQGATEARWPGPTRDELVALAG